MGLLIVDESKCKRDGICVSECPASLIQLPGDRGVPEIIEGGEDACVSCGHCVAVCPQEALSHQRVTLEDAIPIRKDIEINEEQAVQFLRTRRSIRRYKDKPVEQEKIIRLIEAARYAPTGANRQLVEWLVLCDKSKIRKIAGLTIDWLRQILKNPDHVAVNPYLPMVVKAWDAGHDSVLRGAPVLIVASAPKEAMNGMVDLTLALAYLDLLAPVMQLGTCWAGLLQRALLASPPLKSIVGIPEGNTQYYPLMLGYPDAKYYRLPERKQPRIIFG